MKKKNSPEFLFLYTKRNCTKKAILLVAVTVGKDIISLSVSIIFVKSSITFISMRRIINWFGLYVVLCAVNVAGLDLVNTLFGGGSLGGSHHKHNISTSHSEHSMALSSSSGGNHAAASVKVFHFILTPAWGVTAR